VSNSSSSSFCIFGACVEVDELVEKLKKSSSLTEEELEELEEMEENDELWEIGGILTKKTGLSVYNDEDTFWIGKEWQYIRDDETGGEFKKNIETQLEKILGPVDCTTHEEEIYS